jgi:UDP-N-acetylmuramate--alanine ligase
MSGIALVLHERGVSVTGSDLKDSRYSRRLTAAGIPVAVGHVAENLGDPQVVVVSSAIPDRNPELVAARERGIEIWPRARMLGHLAESRRTIAVAGTHGKTTTSSMVAAMLHGMGQDPTFLIGGEVDGFDSNAANGSGEHYVVEADESDGSFVYLDPYVALVTNIEADHMDHYSSLEQIHDTFLSFMTRTAENGALVVCADDATLCSIALRADRTMVTYGFSDSADVRCVSRVREGTGFRFTVEFPDGSQVECVTRVPGVHNVSNATGVLASAWVLQLDLTDAARALSGFSGVRRRFDLIAEVGGVTVVDDYAHHPTEVRAVLDAAQDLGYERIWAVFQPHRYSRTQAFAADFGDSFGNADRVVLMDVYSAGEAPIPGVSGASILHATLDSHPRARAAYLPHREDVAPFVASGAKAGDLVITLGAGDITSIAPMIAEAIGEAANSRRR